MQRTFAVAVSVLTGMISLPVWADAGINSSQSNAIPAVLAFSDTPHIVKRDGNVRVWQHTAIETSPRGKTITKVHSFTELATGVCYKQHGQWVDADPQIIVAQDGTGSGVQAAHALQLLPDVNSDGSVQFTSQNGQQLRGHVVGICYYDWKNQREAQIASIKSSIGSVVGKNQVLYGDAFDSVKADVRYTYRKSGIGQDIILREQLPSPADVGMDPSTTRVEVWTEFLNPPLASAKNVKDQASGQVTQSFVDFGGMRIGRGAAFSIPDGSGQKSKLPVDKQWQQIHGRTFLIESVNYPSLLRRTADLPHRPQAAIQKRTKAIANAASLKRGTPARIASRENSGAKLRIASANSETKGFVVDYELVSGEVSDYTFLGDTTYYITGEFDIDNTLTIEGNSVVKYSSAGTINIGGATICSTASYRPAIFTSQDDDSVGEQISGSSGSPTPIGDNPAVYFQGTNTSLHDVHFFFLNTAIRQIGGVVSLTNIQCVHSLIPIWLYDTTISVNNSLFFDFSELITGEDSSPIIQLLSDTICSGLVTVDANGVIRGATNCIFASVANTDGMGGAYNGFYNSPAFGTLQFTNTTYPFQTGAFGNFYLTNGCAFRDQGTTNIDLGLLGLLEQKTTYPPIVHVSESITNETTYSATAQRDMSSSDGLDLGYHYEPIDHVFSQCDAYSNITFSAGTIAAWYRTTSGFYHVGHGIHMDDQKIATFAGTYEQPCYWIRCNTVQEGSAGEPLTVGYGGITGWADQYLQDPTISPEVHLNFTRCSEMAGEISAYFADDFGYMKVRANHSELYAGYIGN